MVQYQQSLQAKLLKIEYKMKGYFMNKRVNISTPKEIKSMILFLVLAFSSTHLLAEEARLLFKSSFGGSTTIDKTNYHELVGSEDGYAWPYGVPGNNYRVGEGANGRYFNYICDLNNYQEFVDTRIDDVIVPGSTAKKALYMEFKKDDPNMSSMTRNNYAFRPNLDSSDPSERYEQIYFKYKIKQHIKTGASTWKNIAEMKASAGDFRWTLYITNIGAGKTPYWLVRGEDGVSGTPPVAFTASNRDVPVPQDEWFDMEVFVVHSTDSQKGKWQLAINGVIVFDITARTLKSSPPISFWALKNYGAPGWQWVTDLEMYSAPPSSSVLSTSYQPDTAPVTEPDTTPVTESGSFIMSPGVLK